MAECLVAVCNIPSTFHSSDLRNYFSEFVETDEFKCFHFRHRPQSEIIVLERSGNSAGSSTEKAAKNTSQILCTKAVVCLAEFEKPETVTKFRRKYHLQNWVDCKDEILTTRCVVVPLTIASTPDIPTVSIDSPDVSAQLSSEKYLTMPEMKPPALMPKGNVGTPTRHFLNLIKSCQLPSQLIGKLGLRFPKSRTRKYGNVRLDYGAEVGERCIASFLNRKNPVVGSNKAEKDDSAKKTASSQDQVNSAEEEEEEWDRHMALHDDVTEQERTKERLYEEEMEVVWEKGGPGIVWYTDAQVWKEAEGDFDEQTTDDWDVDYSVYFEQGGGDKVKIPLAKIT